MLHGTLQSDDDAIMCPECRRQTDLDGSLKLNVALQDTLRDIVEVKRGRGMALRRWRVLRLLILAAFAFRAAVGRKPRRATATSVPASGPQEAAKSRQQPAERPTSSRQPSPGPKAGPAATAARRGTTGSFPDPGPSRRSSGAPLPRPNSVGKSPVKSPLKGRDRPGSPGTPPNGAPRREPPGTPSHASRQGYSDRRRPSPQKLPRSGPT